MRSVTLCGLVTFWATASAAEPCVTDAFDRPLEGATSVSSHVSDVPSVRFPAFWQEGILDGFRYTILASGEGNLRPTQVYEDWSVSITCSAADQLCTFNRKGTPPPDAIAASDTIGQCLLGVEAGTPEPEPATVQPGVATVPDDLPVVDDLLRITDAPPSPDCGSATLRETTEVATLQRLLQMAGEDPGPVDGFLGPRSFAAMEAFVEDANWDTSIPDTIAVLDAYLCDGAQS